MNEAWTTISGFSRYEVDLNGNIRSRANQKVMHQYADNGYKRITLWNDNHLPKRVSVHRIVAETFIPNVLNLPQVNHKDGDKSNNSVGNLEWCTASENQQHRRNILKSGLKSVRCVETGVVYESIKQAAKANRTHMPNIIRACQNNATAAGLHWEYARR